MNKKKAVSLSSHLRKRRKRSQFNPTVDLQPAAHQSSYFKIEFDEHSFSEKGADQLKDLIEIPSTDKVVWLNIDGIKKEDIHLLMLHFNLHFLLIEDILSNGQRAKIDDLGTHIFALLPFLHFNTDTQILESEQLSMVLFENLIITFQENTPLTDPFTELKKRLKNPDFPARKKKSDYLAYMLIDQVVDHYFLALEPLSNRLDDIEEEVMGQPEKSVLFQLSLLRRELMLFKRNVFPVREMLSNLIHLEHSLLRESTRKYFKDVFDHAALVIEYNENYRELILNLQDLYMNQVNAKMNEVMKILTVVTTILAPFAIIGSVYGMNFSSIPFSNQPYGFVSAIVLMLLISLIMMLIFKKKGWF